MPSFASSLWNSCCCSSRSSVSPLSNGTSAPDCTARLIRPTALEALLGGQNCLAYRTTCSQNPSAGKTSCTRPISFARSNENVSPLTIDRKSTRLNSSHGYISYAVFCLKKKKKNIHSKTSLDRIITPHKTSTHCLY